MSERSHGSSPATKAWLGLAAVALLVLGAFLVFGSGDPEADGGPAAGGAAPVVPGSPTPTARGADAGERTPEAREPGPAPAAPEPPAAAAATAVTGRVVSTGGEPLANARVQAGALAPGTFFDGVHDAENLLAVAEELSGPDGSFRVELDWSAGSLCLSVELEGWERVNRYDLARAPIPEIDAGDVVLGRSPAVCGQVLDELGSPVAGAEILLTELDRPGAQWWAQERPVGQSDGDGSFCVPGLASVPFLLAARTSAAAGDWCAPLSLEPGERREGLELRVTGGVCAVGSVRERGTADPVAGEVRFFPSGSGAPLRARTAADGSFEACGLTPGMSYVFAVYAQGYGQHGGGNVLSVPFDAGEPGSPAPGPLHLVVDPSPEGLVRVVDGRTGAPIAGAAAAWSVRTTERLPPTLNGLAARAVQPIGRTDASGLVELPLRPAWSGGALVQAPGYAPALVIGSTWAGADGGVAELALEPVHELEVRVTGAASSAAAVELFLAGWRWPGDPIFANDPLMRVEVHGGEPALFAGLPPDRYVVLARPAGSPPAWSELVQLEGPGGRTAITVSPPEGARLAGRAAGAPPGAGFAVRALGPHGLLLHAPVLGDSTYALDDLPAGEYQVWPEQAPFQEVVRYGRALPPPHAVPVSLEAGVEVRLDLECGPPATRIEGTLHVNGHPAPHYVVRARSVYHGAGAAATWGTTRETLTDERGRFALDDLRGREVELRASGILGRGNALVVAVQTVAREPELQSVELWAFTARLALAVRAAADSTHVGWSEVRLRPDPDGGGVPGFAGDTGWTIDVKGSGRTGWVELPTGAYRVHATGPGGLRSPEESLRLDLGDETEIELWLESS